jgi:putative peptidoglycan lipid II flippase
VSSLGGSARSMAVGTVASRATGFLRTVVIAGVLGVAAVGDAFSLANTAPNIVYELLLGGVLTSVVVPLLVRAAKQDGDEGAAYAQRLLTLTVLALGVASLLLVLAAPLIVDLYGDRLDPEARDLAVVLARFLLPQVLFYGVGAVLGAYLNTRGRFGPPMWAPVLNNLVVVLTGVVFLLMPGPDRVEPGTITDAQVTVLGIGVTLGIVAQTLALVPALRSVGFRFVPRLDLRGAGLGHAARLAKWVFLSVVISQAAYVVVVKLAIGAGALAPGRGYASYTYAYVLWQLPHAVVAVSVITALLPRMSRAAGDGRTDDLRRSLNHGLRLTVAVLVPAAVAFLVLGRVLAVSVFTLVPASQVSAGDARFIGVLLAVFAIGLVPYSTYQVQLRSFYAMQDTRTPMLINLGVSATVVVVDLVLYALLPDDLKVVGLAAGHAASFAAGLVLCSTVLSRRIGGLEGGAVLQTAARCLLAAFAAALPTALVVVVLPRLVGDSALGSLVTLVVGGLVLAAGYVLVARRLRVREVDEVAGPVLRRLRLG